MSRSRHDAAPVRGDHPDGTGVSQD